MASRVSRLLLAPLGLLVLLGACSSGSGGSAPAARTPAAASAPPAAAPAATTAPAAKPAALTRVRMGSQLVAGDIAIFVAQELNYFAQEGIDFELVSFSNASEMIPALATDQIEVGSMPANPAGWNAVARGIPIKSVLDKGSFPPAHGDQSLAIRKDLYDAGRGRSLADLRGLNIAITPPGKGTTSACAMSAGLQRIGGSLDDFNITPLGFPDMVPAFTNGAIDGAMITEPFLSRAVRQGSAVRVVGIDEMYPYFQITTLGFSGTFYNNRPAAKGFTKAYIRATRDYLAAAAGRPGPIDRAKVDELIARNTRLDIAAVRDMSLPGLNPNGVFNREAMLYCYQFFREQGLIPEPISDAAFAALWGTDLVDEVLAEIGRVPD
jgi:NitT/TauT family transport system substrate-binding protein